MLTIDYFTDVLCIWSYISQRRVDELKQEFGNQIQLRYRYCPSFADTESRIGGQWHAKGGYEAFNKHIAKIASGWEHIKVHPQLWLQQRPASSTGIHVLLKAIQLLEDRGAISAAPKNEFEHRSLLEETAWRLRLAFFRDAYNIAERGIRSTILSEMDMPIEKIEKIIDSGEAYAELQKDTVLTEKYHIPGSPTFVLNEGRQILYGNIGYRIIEANIRELLRNPKLGEASWC